MTVPTIRSTSEYESTAVATSHTVGLPAGFQAGDLLVMGAEWRVTGVTATTPAGWTLIDGEPGTNVSQATWYKQAAGGDSNPAIALSGVGANLTAQVIAITTGTWDTAAPINAHSILENAADTNVTASSITTTVADCLLLYFGAAVGAVTFTPPSGMTEQQDSQSTDSTNNCAGELATLGLGAAGATGDKVGTIGSSQRNIAALIAIAPAGGISSALAFKLQMQFSGAGGAWTDVWDDVRIGAAPVVARYGISGNGPLDLIASTGSMTFALDNSANNSAGSVGYYSPGHASCRSGFDEGIGVRLDIEYGGTAYYKFRGTLDDIDPLPFTTRERLTYCTVLDWMDEAAKESISGVATLVGKRVDEIIGTVVAAMPRQPASTSYAAGGAAFPYALDTAKAETPAMSELARAVMSDMGALFVKGDTSAGGKLTYQDRRARQAPGSALTTLANTMQGVKVRRARGRLYTRVKVAVHPRTVDADATTVLYSLDQSNPPSIAAGETLTIEGQYRDPNQVATRVGGTDMVTPVSGTDYAMGTGPGDTSLTANLTVTATFGSSGVTLALENTGSVTGFVTLLQVRGRGLYDYVPITVKARSITNESNYGGQKLEMDMPYEASASTGQAIADYWLSKLKDPIAAADSVDFLAHEGNATLLVAALAREVGDVIAITETLTALSAVDHFIQQIELAIRPNKVINCRWILAPRYDSGSYWVLGTSTLGTSTILGL